MLKLENACMSEFSTIRDIYYDIIDSFDGMDNILYWEKGIYPEESEIRRYIKEKTMYKLTNDDAIVGCVVLDQQLGNDMKGIRWHKETSHYLVIHLLGINPAYQNKGYAYELLQLIENYAQEKGIQTLRLDTTKENVPAQKLYEKYGFKFIESKKMWFPDTGDITFNYFDYML